MQILKEIKNFLIRNCLTIIMIVMFVGFCVMFINSAYLAYRNDLIIKQLENSQNQLLQKYDKLYSHTEYLYCLFDSSLKKQNDIQTDDQFVQLCDDEIIEVIDNNADYGWYIGQELPLPDIPTNIKLCTDYRFYNITGTPHNRMQNNCYTDEYGIRKYKDDYCVGLGSFYSVDIGDRFEITLENEEIFTVIMADGKADCDTDVNNMYTPCINYDNEDCANVLEFIIDQYAVSAEMYQYGSLDYYEKFKGNITKMVYLGRDNSNDWNTYY